MVKIRLMRIGAKKRPFYRVVAVDERAKRTGGYIELLGTYNPLTEPKEILLKQDRIDDWIKKGAQMSDGFLRIIGKAPQRPPRKAKREKKEAAPVAAEAPAPKPTETPVEESVEETPKEVEAPAEEPKREGDCEEGSTGTPATTVGSEEVPAGDTEEAGPSPETEVAPAETPTEEPEKKP